MKKRIVVEILIEIDQDDPQDDKKYSVGLLLFNVAREAGENVIAYSVRNEP